MVVLIVVVVVVVLVFVFVPVPLVDGAFVSADYGVLKPDKTIFNLFCEKFSVIPSECVFIDDTSVNVKSAAEMGFAGIVFSGDVNELKNEFARLKIIE